MRVILGPFCPNLGENEFSWKKGLCRFLDIPTIYHHAKNEKKLMCHFEKNARLTDKQTTDRQTDRQTDKCDFIGPSAGQGLKKSLMDKILNNTLSKLEFELNYLTKSTTLKYVVQKILPSLLNMHFSCENILIILVQKSNNDK